MEKTEIKFDKKIFYEDLNMLFVQLERYFNAVDSDLKDLAHSTGSHAGKDSSEFVRKYLKRLKNHIELISKE